jgi:hypothetical protein
LYLDWVAIHRVSHEHFLVDDPLCDVHAPCQSHELVLEVRIL